MFYSNFSCILFVWLFQLGASIVALWVGRSEWNSQKPALDQGFMVRYSGALLRKKLLSEWLHVVCLIFETIFEPSMSWEVECSCDLLLFKSPLNWGPDSFIWVHHPDYPPMYSPSQLLTYPGLMYEAPHRLLMYCWYMRLRQLSVIYAGITIDARTGHTLVGLH